MSEKRVKVAVLIAFSYKRMFFFCLSNDFRVKFGFYVVFDGKGLLDGLTVLFLVDAGSERFRV